MNQKDFKDLVKLMPENKQEILRYEKILKSDELLRIAVFGKYNHGKSTLLNSLVGQEIFKASDKRETITNQTFESNGVIWIDTPGLDADVNKKDDEKAINAATQDADIIFFIHNLNTGELDKNEVMYLKNISSQKNDPEKRIFLIITQIDQVSPEQSTLITNKIKAQIKNIQIIHVSATRYLSALKTKNKNLSEISNMNELFNLIALLINNSKQLKNDESMILKKLLIKKISEKMDESTEKEKKLGSEIAYLEFNFLSEFDSL